MSQTILALSSASLAPPTSPDIAIKATSEQQIAGERLFACASRINSTLGRSMTPYAQAQLQQLIREAQQQLSELRRRTW